MFKFTATLDIISQIAVNEQCLMSMVDGVFKTCSSVRILGGLSVTIVVFWEHFSLFHFLKIFMFLKPVFSLMEFYLGPLSWGVNLAIHLQLIMRVRMYGVVSSHLHMPS